MTNPDEYSFPQKDWTQDFQTGQPIPGICGGLTKREYFSARALQGLLSDIYSSAQGYELIRRLEKEIDVPNKTLKFSEQVACNAVIYADALIKELNKNSIPPSDSIVQEAETER